MHSHLHADDVGPVPLGARLPGAPRPDLPQVKIRPPWLIFLARHFAPRNHERYLMQGIELTAEELAAIRAMPRGRPWWLAFLLRQRGRFFGGDVD